MALLDSPHIPNEAAPGVTLQLKGWITDADYHPVEQAWVEIAGAFVPVVLDRDRLDVARLFAARDRDGRRLGFDAVATLPHGIPAGTFDARVIGRGRSGRGLYAHTAQRVSIAHPRVAARSVSAPAHPVRFGLRVRDSQIAGYTLGRGAYTVRQESSLRLSGFVDGATALHAIARSAAGLECAWDFGCNPDGRFDALLWTGDMERGFYDLTLCRVDESYAVPVACSGFDIAGPHYLPPLNLRPMLSRPLAGVTTFEDAGPIQAGTRRAGYVAGRPIGISGWCLDPASNTPPLAVYVQIDAARPVPLSHHLPDPRAGHDPAGVRCGFGGIVDTTLLEPGTHTVRLLAAAVSGAGWYVVDDRQIVLADHRALPAAP